ncbi:hypothetical protein GCM10009552_41840 [Rothia nasimurium]
MLSLWTICVADADAWAAGGRVLLDDAGPSLGEAWATDESSKANSIARPWQTRFIGQLP